MKNTAKFLAILVFAALIGFAITACDNGAGGGDGPSAGTNPFIGTWTGTNSGGSVKLVMTNNTWAITYLGTTYNGNYARTSDTSTLVTLKYNSGATAGLALYNDGPSRVTVSLTDTVPATNTYK